MMRMWEPSPKQGEREVREDTWNENGRNWPRHTLKNLVAEREQPQRWEANQHFRLVEGTQWSKGCCRVVQEEVVQEELEGAAMGLGDL